MTSPTPAPQCFWQPCFGRQVTLRVLNCLPHMTACYVHATDIVAMFKPDYPDICLEPLGAPARRPAAPICSRAAPSQVPTAPLTIEPCLLACGKPGNMTVHSTLNATKSVLHVCPGCFFSTTDALRSMGHSNIYCGDVLPSWWPLRPDA